MPDGSKATSTMPTKTFVQGRRLKRIDALAEYCFWVLALRSPSQRARQMAPCLPNGVCGLINTVAVDPAYPKRAAKIAVLTVAAPGAAVSITTDALEESDPVAYPPGFPERAVSLLEE